MNNDEKRDYLTLWHTLLMSHHGAVEVDQIPDWEALAGFKDFYEDSMKILYPRLPKKFFRYRKCKQTEFENLKNGTAWFSHPDQFDDSLDTSLNMDLEEEVKELENNDELRIEFLTSLTLSLLEKAGIPANRELVMEAMTKTDKQGFELGLSSFLKSHLDSETSDLIADRTKSGVECICDDKMKKNVQEWCENWQDSNKKMRESVFDLCLVEEYDNDAMWGTYSDNCTGFCIQYEIEPNSELGVMTLANIFPIYYGEKEKIRFVDLLMHGMLNSDGEMVIGGITKSDYEKMHISSYTKSPIWSFQKEWRVTYGKTNLQPFPFATGLILGERIKEEDKNELIKIAQDKGLTVYQRKLNRSGSKIIYEKIM